MTKEALPQQPATQGTHWKRLLEQVFSEQDPALLAQHVRQAKEAIILEMEGSFAAASHSERCALLAALNTISGLHESAHFPRSRSSKALSQSA